MVLDDFRILGLTKDLKQVIITNEVESRELLTLLFKVVIEGLLAHLKLSEDCLKSVLKTWDFDETHDQRVSANTKSDRSVLFIDAAESALF